MTFIVTTVMVSKGEGQFLRYSDEQRNYADGMDILIKLYYCLKETDQTDWQTDSVIRSVAELAFKVLPDFKKCLYIKSPEQPKLKFFSPKGGVLYVHKKNFRKFLYAMDAFVDEREKQPIHVVSVSRESKRAPYSDRGKIENNEPVSKTIYRDSEGFYMLPFVPGSRNNIPEGGYYAGMASPPDFRETIHFYADPDSNFVKTLYRGSDNIAILSKILDSFYDVPDSVSKFAKALRSSPHRRIETINKVSLEIHLKKSTFIDLLQYFFAKYIDVFGSFDRIAQCGYEPCGKLFFDFRSGRRHFCSGLCRKKAHDALRDPVKLRCQNKQNVWIRRKSDELSIKPYTVYKDRCDRCDHPVDKGGLCPVLCGGNKKMYAEWEQQKKLPRERLHIEKFDKHLRPPKR